MTRMQSFDIDPADVDADGLAQSQTPLASGNLTLNGALISGGSFTESSGHGRQLGIASVGDDSGRTFTVTGTDADGTAITETITGPNATTVESTRYFKTVSSVAVDAATAGAITVGTVDELATKTYFLNRQSDTGALVQFDVTGTINLTAQVSAHDIRNNYTNQEAIPWVATTATALVNATADALGRLDAGASVARFIVNSYSSGAEVQVYVSEDAD
jgi:hypothetical protein